MPFHCFLTLLTAAMRLFFSAFFLLCVLFFLRFYCFGGIFCHFFTVIKTHIDEFI